MLWEEGGVPERTCKLHIEKPQVGVAPGTLCCDEHEYVLITTPPCSPHSIILLE